MRIGLAGWGSEGDLRPLVALAARLRREGHSPQLVLTPIDGLDYRATCEELGVALRVVPPDIRISLEKIARDARSADPSRLSRALLDEGFFPFLEAMYDAALELCTQSDVVVGLFSSWYVKAAALKSGVKFATVHYYPGLVPSRHAPPPALPAWRWFNRPGWALLNFLVDLGFRGPAAAFFASKGLPPVRHAIPDVLCSDRLNLLAASPAFWPPAPDWGETNRVCGELVLPASDWQPSPGLQAFLADGPPPVLLTLGSMEHLAPERARSLLVDSARGAKVRALVQTKGEGRREEGRDGDLYFLPWAPHGKVMPLCSAVVHHGGAGTTHAALRAGRPQVVLPFIFEQQLWARRAEAAGAAVKPLSFWKARPGPVADRIRAARGTESLRLRAQALAAAMAGEDGTGEATRLLERMASGERTERRLA